MKNIILNNETFEVHKDRNWYVIEHPIQPLIGLGLSLEEALQDLKTSIELCIEEYVEVDEEILTEGSKEFRKFLIEYAKNN